MSSENTVATKPASNAQMKGRKTHRRRNVNKAAANTSTNPVDSDKSELAVIAPAPSILEGREPEVEEDEDASLCWICAEPVKFFSLSACNHRTCHVCAVRLRALYKKLECTFCKNPQQTVLFTSSSDKPFAEFDIASIPFKDSKLSIVFETQEMMEETLILLRFNCPDEECLFVASGWNDLKLHVRGVHSKVMCDLCIRFKKVFSHEHALYAPNQLYLHLPSINHRHYKTTHKERLEGGVHPMCEFCQECVFGDDELFSHMREKHEECFLCKRNGIRDKYFVDYHGLERHFMDDHYPCKQAGCLMQKFVVFASAMDLQAHMVEEHGETMSSRDKKDARRVVAEFDFRDQMSVDTQRRRRGVLGSSLNQTAQSETPRNRREGFGATLTAPEGVSEGIVLPIENFPPSQQRSQLDPGTPVDDATLERHAAFNSRMTTLTHNSVSAMSAIKSSIVSFRLSESTARDLISTFFNVLDRNIDATASLIVALVDLLDNEEKRTNLLQSWNGFKVEHRREFPDLMASATGSGYAGVASGRVLNVKHSTTARSSSQSSTQVWDRVARAAASPTTVPHMISTKKGSSGVFPSLTNASGSQSRPPVHSISHQTPWVSSSRPVAALQVKPQGAGSVASASIKQLSLSSSAFPTLPSSSASTSTKPTVSGNRSLQNILGNTPPPVAWNASGGNRNGSGGNQESIPRTPPLEELEQKKGRKKKGKEKQMLFTLGSFPTG